MTDREIAVADLESLKKGVKKDDKYGKESWGNMGKRIFWNGTAPYTSEGGKAIVPTAIKAGQEVIYSKILRKFMKADNKSWLGLTMFSILTAVFDEGLGAWYGEHKRPQDQGLSDVAMEFPRPILSCLAINYIMNVAYMGIHNPMRSFGFKELLIQLAAKDLAEGGNAIMAQNFDGASEQLAKARGLKLRQYAYSRLYPTKTTAFQTTEASTGEKPYLGTRRRIVPSGGGEDA